MTTAIHHYSFLLSAGLLSLGFLVEMARYLARRRRAWTGPWGAGFLWAGTVILLMAALSGFLPPLAKPSVMADRSLWTEHLVLGLWGAGVFVVLSFWRAFSRRRPGAIFTFVWAAGLWVLWAVLTSGRSVSFY